MSLIVSDANIFIDMEAGGLIRQMFHLPEIFSVPNILYEEELLEHHPELPTYGLVILDIKPVFVSEAFRLGGIYNEPSQNDLLALALAKQEKCPLLTGDGKLRRAAEKEAVEVKGTLWLMQEMINKKLINYETTKAAYDSMRAEGRRLPWDKIEKQLGEIVKN